MDIFTYLMSKKGKSCLPHKNDLFSYLLGVKKRSVLPKEYVEVNYIESSGTQYINTDVKLGVNNGFYIKYLTKSYNTTTYGQYGCIFGGRNASGNKDYQFGTYTTSQDGTGSLRWGNSTTNSVSNNAGILRNTIQEASLINKVYTAPNGTTYTILTDTETCDYNCFIFGLSDQNYLTQAGLGCRIYNLKLFDGDILIRDFIPCYRKSDNVIGLYDIVNNVFYTNKGSGGFIYG